MTYGDLRFRLTKAFPGVDADLIDGWISDTYQDILAELPWQRQAAKSILRTVAPYTTGTVAVANGSASVSLTGGTWTSLMTGRSFRVGQRNEYYEFSFGSATAATLDRGYEGPDETGAGYSIFQSTYPLPLDCRHLEDEAFSSFEFGPLRRLSREQMDEQSPNRLHTGRPCVWSSYMDDVSDPPRMQVELLPVPNEAIGIPFDYISEAATPTGTSATLLPWIQPTALIELTSKKICNHLEKFVRADRHHAAGKEALGQMRQNEAFRMGPITMELGDQYTDHRRRRWCR